MVQLFTECLNGINLGRVFLWGWRCFEVEWLRDSKHWHSCVCCFRGGLFFLKGPVEALCRRLGNFAIEQWTFVKLKATWSKSLFPHFQVWQQVIAIGLYKKYAWTLQMDSSEMTFSMQLWLLSFLPCNLGWQLVNRGRGSCLSFCAIERCFADATVKQHATDLYFIPHFFSDIYHILFHSGLAELGIDLDYKGLHTVLILVTKCMFTTGGISMMGNFGHQIRFVCARLQGTFLGQWPGKDIWSACRDAVGMGGFFSACRLANARLWLAT